MMSVNLWLIGLVILNFILGVFALSVLIRFNRLTRGVAKGNLEKIIGSFTKISQDSKKTLVKVNKRLTTLEREKVFYFQKIGLIKFNPFADLGGDQSFSLAVMNDDQSGLVITSLHGRNTTRVYAKLVSKEDNPRLSKEELSAIKKANSNKQ